MAQPSDSRLAAIGAVASGVAGGLSRVSLTGGSAIYAAASSLTSYVKGDEGVPALGMSPGAEADADPEGTLRGLGGSEMLHVANTLDGIFASVVIPERHRRCA